MDFQAIEISAFLWAVMFEFLVPRDFLYALIESAVVFGNIAGIPWFSFRRLGLRNLKTLTLLIVSLLLTGYFGYFYPGHNAIPVTLPISVVIGALWYEFLFQWHCYENTLESEATIPVSYEYRAD